jgi:septum site-determining protein MinD
MAGKILVVTSGKGGVGKTTTVANLGTVLATKKYSVVMIDGDIGLRNLDVVMGLENRIVYNLVDIIEEKCRIQQAMIRDRKMNNLCIIPAAQTREKDAVQPEQMKALCS